MSSSQGLALYGFTRNREIGVDVERVRDIPEMDRIVNLIFSTRKSQVYCTLPKDLQREAFFTYWTRREALVKAMGEGLSWPLSEIDLIVDPAGSATLLYVDADSRREGRWSIHDLEPASEFAAAMAVEGGNCPLHCWQWTEEYNSLQ
jgi:4'-phosphopantetheinyl transferase